MVRNSFLVSFALVLLVLCGASQASAIIACEDCGCGISCSATCVTDSGVSTCGASGPSCGPCGGCLTVGQLASLQLEPKPMTPADPLRGRVMARLTWRLAQHVEEMGLGEVYAAETGVLPGLRGAQAPDLAFVQQDRRGTAGAPDLAVEILSTLEPIAVTNAKVRTWLAAGTRTVLVIDPSMQTVAVHRSRGGIELLRANDFLEVPALLPGWAVRVGDLFED